MSASLAGLRQWRVRINRSQIARCHCTFKNHFQLGCFADLACIYSTLLHLKQYTYALPFGPRVMCASLLRYFLCPYWNQGGFCVCTVPRCNAASHAAMQPEKQLYVQFKIDLSACIVCRLVCT